MTRWTSSHALTAATKAENSSLIEGQIRFSLVSQSGKTLKGNEGAVVSFTVEATDELAEDSKITLKDAFITNTSASNVVADCEANVHNSNYVRPVLTLSAQDFELTPTKQQNLSFAFATNREVSALQADITLPAGLEFVENEDGEYATFNMSRLTSSHTPSTTLNGNKLNIILSSTKSSNLKGEDGELFCITLKATGDLAAESVITIDRVIASTSAGKRQDIPAIEVKVSNPDVAAKAATETEYGYTAHKACSVCGEKDASYKVLPKTGVVRGDLDNDGKVTRADAIYLLRSTILSAQYPLNQGCDFNKDGKVDKADALYLLRHTILPSQYPLD